ncbi:MAG: hypothetical protein HKP21_10700 [Xanthomonadales bacterium]|nr:hypothetical protein [Gammaproteobacteria bacterium]NNK05016.1 hypothetical protein [Xanthomonadales bacterium]
MPKTDEEIFVMAYVDDVRLAITASTTKPGYSDIAYSYELYPSELDCSLKREYTISAVLCGKDLIEDDVLAWGKDEHKAKFDDSGPCEAIKVERVFKATFSQRLSNLTGHDEIRVMYKCVLKVFFYP